MKIHSHIFAGILLALGFSVCGHNGSDLLFDKKKTTGAEENTGGDSVSVSTIPANGATSVLTSTTITVTFSTAMNTATVTTNTADTVCSGSLQVSSDNFTTCVRMNSPMSSSGGDTIFTMTPMTALTGNPTNYKIRVTTAAQNTAGTSLATTFVSSFTTQDLIDPTVSNVTPGGGTTGVATGTSVTVTFSEAMSTGTLTVDTNTTCSGSFQLYITAGTCVPMNASIAVSGGNTQFTFTPQAALVTSSTYTVKITTASQDGSGRGLSSNYTTTFTTAAGADVTRPTVSSTTPSNSATGISLSSAISVTFSEAMSVASLTATTTAACVGSVQLSKVSDNFATNTCIPMTSATPTASGGNTTFSVTPAANLAGGTSYRIKVTTAVADVATNTLLSDFTADFTTVAAPIYLFRTTSTTTGIVGGGAGGRANANLMCTTSSSGYSFPTTCSTSVAVISIGTGDAITDMSVPAGRPIQGPGGAAFQTDWTTFINNGPPSATAADSAGILPTGTRWWSFSAAALPPTGLPAAQSCTGGTSASGNGRGGQSDQTGSAFFNPGGSPLSCGTAYVLLCICY